MAYMAFSLISQISSYILVLANLSVAANVSICHSQPGDSKFPSLTEWNQLNSSVGGRLITVIPSAQYCHQISPGGCTQAQWTSSGFRGNIPGAMDDVNWEQDYTSNPPSLCLLNGTVCGQGNVPLYAINASSAADIQVGINFARRYNVKVAIKSSGHDFLGRSTAKNSLLLWTHYLRNMSFTDNFVIGNTDFGSAVTVGSGVPLNNIYLSAKAEGKIFVGGNAAHVVAAGGYAQGAGHSAYSPIFGLAADNALEFDIVLSNGTLVTTNEIQHPNLFWALRGGGAGSWGVIISATFRTYPTFNATLHTVEVLTGSNSSTGDFFELHARHIFDWDDYRAGQYFISLPGPTGNVVGFLTYFANLTSEQSINAMKPLLDEARAMNFTVTNENTTSALANDLVYSADDNYSGVNAILGSRLIPADAYRNNAAGIGQACATVLEQGTPSFLGLLIGGGQVADNANIQSAVNPKWRTAKVHFIVTSIWEDSLPPDEVEALKQRMTQETVPVLANVTGESDSGSYSNEADVREPDFQTTFFGAGYARLRDIKRTYDPDSMFIVPAGVGSEDWDEAGLCRVV